MDEMLESVERLNKDDGKVTVDDVVQQIKNGDSSAPPPMCGVPPSGVRHRRYCFPSNQAAVDDLVSRDLPPYPVQERHLRARAFAPTRRSVQHRLDAQTQAHARHERARIRQAACRSNRDRRRLPWGELAREPGEAGRGSPNKTPFVTAVETNEQSHPQRIAMQVVEGFTLAEIADFARRKLASSYEVFSDGLNCFPGVIQAGCSHSFLISGGRKSAEAPTFKWVNTALGNIKSALSGTYRHHDPKHAPRYLAEFQYRFNRRFDLAGMLTRLAFASVRTPPSPYKLLKLAESNA